MKQDLPSVWIIILNWNGLDDTLVCLASLAQVDPADAAVHILVIDNGSRYDPRPTIIERFPSAEVVRLERNIGFAGGCNYGIERALHGEADYVLLLNNDTIVDPDFLAPLLTYLQCHPRTGAVAPLICYADQPDRVWFAGATIIMALGYFEHRSRLRHRQEVAPTPLVSDYLSGCCMLIPASVIRTVGRFDEQMFAYFEDAEFCLRVRQAGYDLVCVPQSVIWHKESASTRKDLAAGTTSPLKHYLSMRNRIVTVVRHSNLIERMCFLLLSTPVRTLFYLGAFTVRRRWAKLAMFTMGVVDGLGQRFNNAVIS